jgi:hypothetical protein
METVVWYLPELYHGPASLDCLPCLHHHPLEYPQYHQRLHQSYWPRRPCCWYIPMSQKRNGNHE